MSAKFISSVFKQEVEVGLHVFVPTLCANILVSLLEDKYIFLYLLHAYEMFLVIIAYSEGVNSVMKNIYIVLSKGR